MVTNVTVLHGEETPRETIERIEAEMGRADPRTIDSWHEQLLNASKDLLKDASGEEAAA